MMQICQLLGVEYAGTVNRNLANFLEVNNIHIVMSNTTNVVNLAIPRSFLPISGKPAQHQQQVCTLLEHMATRAKRGGAGTQGSLS